MGDATRKVALLNLPFLFFTETCPLPFDAFILFVRTESEYNDEITFQHKGRSKVASRKDDRERRGGACKVLGETARGGGVTGNKNKVIRGKQGTIEKHSSNEILDFL